MDGESTPAEACPCDGRVTTWRMLTAVRGNMLETFTTRLFAVDHLRRLFGTFYVHFIMTADAIRYTFRDGSQSGALTVGAIRMSVQFDRSRFSSLLRLIDDSFLKAPTAHIRGAIDA